MSKQGEFYTLVRSRRKTLSMRVGSEGVVVYAPLRLPLCEIERFAEQHRQWAERKLAERTPEPAFADGERIEVLGRERTIQAARTASLSDDSLLLPAEGRREALISLLKKLTRERMTRLVAALAQQYGFRYSSIRVGSARGRWGSYSAKGNLSFTFRSAFLPESLAKYLAVHELCHSKHFDHSAAFWRDVEHILPDYMARRRALRRYTWAMGWL